MKKPVAFYRMKYRSMLTSGTLTMAIVYLMLICDYVVVGQMIGHEGVSAINMVAPQVGLSIFASSVIPEGIAIMYTRAIGAMKREKADQIFGMGVIASVSLALIIALLLSLVRKTYLATCGATGTILTYAAEYYIYLPLYALLLILGSLIEQMVYSDGDEKLETFAYAAQIVVNIVLSIVLAKSIGMRGVMLGSVIGYATSIVIMCQHFFKPSNTLRFVPYFSLRELMQCVEFSITDAVVYLLWGVMDFVLIRFITANFGEKYLVVLAVVYSLIELSAIFDGIGMAIQPLIGVYYGEGNTFMIRRLMKDAILTALAEGVLATALVIAFAPQLARLFGIQDAAMLAPAVRAIRIVAATLTVSSLFMLATSYYLYIDHVWLSVWALVLKEGVACTLMPVVCAGLFGVDGLWIGFAVAPLVGLAASMLMIDLVRGKASFPWLLEINDEDTFVYDARLTPQSMTEAAVAIQRQMEARGYQRSEAMKAALFTEEISATVLEVNGDADILAEYSLLFSKESVRLIIRDSGAVFDITDPDLKITGLSSFVISGLLNAKKDKNYIPTTGYNRNLIRFEYVFNESRGQ